MFFNRVLTKQQVVEEYRIPAGLVGELFAVLKPISGHGEAAVYLESLIDEALHKYFGRGYRPAIGKEESTDGKEAKMNLSWARTVEKDEPEDVIVAELLLVNEKTAAQMLGVSKRTIFDLNKKGVLACKQIGKLKRYAVADLRAFAEGKVA